MRIKKRREAGFTLVEIMIVVAIIGMLAAIAIPNFVRARTTAQKNACINNLRQIDGAIQQYALENNKSGTDPVTLDNCAPYLGRGAATTFGDTNIKCPAGGTYSTSDVATKPLCSTPTHELGI